MSPATKQIGIYASIVIACLAIGYFAGREHVKYELRSAMQTAAESFRENMRLALGGGPALATSPVPAEAPAAVPSTAQQPFAITLLEKAYKPSDPQAHDYQDAITIKVAFKNESGKDVRAFDGVLTFTDLLDNEILSSKLAVNEAVASGASMNWEGGIDYNQFMDSHRGLRAADQASLKVRFDVKKVLFSDGSTKTY